MKKYINILLPAASLVIAGTAITSCAQKSNVIPKDFLIIEKTEEDLLSLKGFKEDHKFIGSVNGYSILTIPKEVEVVESQSFTPNPATEYRAPEVITTINYEEGSLCTDLADHDGTNFNNLPNLETVIFPPKYEGFDKYLFRNCSKISTLDFSNVEKDLVNVVDGLVDVTGWPTSGQIIIKGTKNLEAANKIINFLHASHKTDWTIVQK